MNLSINLALAVFVFATIARTATAHPGHVDPESSSGAAAPPRMAPSTITLAQANDDAEASETATSGQGALRFRVVKRGSDLPREAVAVLVKAHGGFAVDRRPGKGEVYFALPGAGIIQLSSDLMQSRMVRTPSVIAETTMHNATIWYDKGGTPYLTLPGVSVAKVFTTTLEGELVHTLEHPGKEHDFNNARVNAYFGDGETFVPTDVEYLNGTFYVATGYSSLDYVLTARVKTAPVFDAGWHTLAFGGRGDEAGQFGTGHGITVPPEGNRIDVADRPNSEIDRFTPDGKYVDTVDLPEGAWPCDIDYAAGYAIVGCLHGPDRGKGAPIYILKEGKVVSTVMPKEDLGLGKFQHIHNAVLLEVKGKLYIVAQAWNPGDFTVLEQVSD